MVLDEVSGGLVLDTDLNCLKSVEECLGSNELGSFVQKDLEM